MDHTAVYHNFHIFQAMEILTRELGENNFLLVVPKNALAAIKQDKAEREPSKKKKAELYKDAEKLKREIVEVLKAKLGEFNPATSMATGNLGLLYQDMGKFAEAEKMFKNSMKALVAIQGPEDDRVALTHNRLAQLYRCHLEDFSKAEEHYLQSIKIKKNLFGPAYSQLQFSYNGLQMLYEKTGEEAKRREFEEKQKEWRKLQKEKKSEEEKEEDKKMDFEEMVEFVKNT